MNISAPTSEETINSLKNDMWANGIIKKWYMIDIQSENSKKNWRFKMDAE